MKKKLLSTFIFFYIKIPKFLFLELIKFIRDTLQNSDNKYSTKNTMVAQTFILIAWAFIYETIKNQSVNQSMFQTLVTLAFGTTLVTSGANIINKKIDNSAPENPTVNINIPEISTVTIEKSE